MKILNNKAGVTVLEGVIALGLLAVITAGAFGVLASAARKSSQPDMREEMTLAVENAKNLLKMYSGTPAVDTEVVASSWSQEGLCDDDATPLEPTVDYHDIKCMLPLICDKTHPQSYFKYQVETVDVEHRLAGEDVEILPQVRKIIFKISCNGYEL